jgi:hypothetical protein
MERQILFDQRRFIPTDVILCQGEAACRGPRVQRVQGAGLAASAAWLQSFSFDNNR